jgi:hypothetical protein
MTDIREPAAPARGLLAGYVSEAEMAQARGVGKRALRAERLRNDGPPWIKISRAVF